MLSPVLPQRGEQAVDFALHIVRLVDKDNVTQETHYAGPADLIPRAWFNRTDNQSAERV